MHDSVAALIILENWSIAFKHDKLWTGKLGLGTEMVKKNSLKMYRQFNDILIFKRFTLKSQFLLVINCRSTGIFHEYCSTQNVILYFISTQTCG